MPERETVCPVDSALSATTRAYRAPKASSARRAPRRPFCPVAEPGPASRRRAERRARRRAQALALALLVALVAACAFYTGRASAALTPATVAYWDRVAQCETGRRWQAPGPTYQGGVGFYWATWDWWARELGLHRRYPDAHLAPRLVQIRVADYGRRVHRGYWGCA